MMKKSAKKSLIFLLVLIPFNAFLITFIVKIFHLNITAQLIISSWKEAILVFALICALVEIARSKKIGIQLFWFDYLIFGLFLLALILISKTEKNWINILWGIRYDFEIFIIYFVFRYFFQSQKEILNLLKWIIIPASIIVIYGILQLFILPKDFLINFGYSNFFAWQPGLPLPAYQIIGISQIVRLQSLLAGPNQLGSYLIIIIGLTLYLMIKFHKTKYFIWLVILSLLSLINLFYTYSRSGWVGFLVMLIVFLFFYFKKKVYYLIFLGLILICGLTFYFTTNNYSGTQFYNDFIQHQASNSERITNLNNGIKLIKQNPLGQGPGSAGLATTKNSVANFVVPENWFIQVGVEYGILGLITFIGILFGLALKLLQKYLRQKKLIFATVFSIFIGLIVHSLFLHTWSDITTNVIFWSILGSVISFSEINTKSNIKKVGEI